MSGEVSSVEVIVVTLNACAAFYATIMWAFFGAIRLASRSWFRGILNIVLAICALMAGVYFLMFFMGAFPPLYLLSILRWIVAPLLFGPALQAYLQYKAAQVLMDHAHQIEDDIERMSDTDEFDLPKGGSS